ncbi:MAG: hypothetical protein Q7R95_10040 [bacterium]|nr:hypothetical protein [bacterium]
MKPEQLGFCNNNQTITENFWQCVRKGKYTPLSHREISKYVDRMYFGFDPLLPLKDFQHYNIRNQLINGPISSLNNMNLFYKLATGPVVYLSAEEAEHMTWISEKRGQKNSFYASLFCTEMAADIAINSYHKKPLNPNELRALLTNQNIGHDALLVSNHTGNPDWITMYEMTNNKHRSLFNLGGPFSGYNLTSNHLAQIIYNTHSKSGKSDLIAFDIGGSNGKKAYELKQFDPSLTVVNTTLEEEILYYPNDANVIMTAERMPKKLFEAIDIVLSNFALTYCYYPDIALYNIILSLSLGGCAYVDFNSYNSPNTDNSDLQQRMNTVAQTLNKLHEKGLIDFNLYPANNHNITNQRIEITKKERITPNMFKY